jgi:hypothetical protein
MKRELLFVCATSLAAVGCASNAGDIPLLHSQNGMTTMPNTASSAIKQAPSITQAPKPEFHTDLTEAQIQHCLEVGEASMDTTGAFKFSDDAERCGEYGAAMLLFLAENKEPSVNPDQPIPNNPDAGLITWFQREADLPETNLFDVQTIRALKSAVDHIPALIKE